MRTSYLGIESIIVESGANVTLACNVMFEGQLYSEPIYTNIFCDFEELQSFLSRENTLGNRILNEIMTQVILDDDVDIQINLPDYIENKVDWAFPLSVNLEEELNLDFPFQCYRLGKQ